MQDLQTFRHADRTRNKKAAPNEAKFQPASGSSSFNPESDKYQIRAKKGFLNARNITSGLVLLIYSKEFHLGVLLHLPTSAALASSRPETQGEAFAKSALSMILTEFETLGVSHRQLVTYVIGGSANNPKQEVSKVEIQRILWSYGLSLSACDLGGRQIRSIWMEVESGRIIVRSETMPKDGLSAQVPVPVAS